MRRALLLVHAVYPMFMWVAARYPCRRKSEAVWVYYPLGKTREESAAIPGTVRVFTNINNRPPDLMFFIPPEGGVYDFTEVFDVRCRSMGLEVYWAKHKHEHSSRSTPVKRRKKP